MYVGVVFLVVMSFDILHTSVLPSSIKWPFLSRAETEEKPFGCPWKHTTVVFLFI